MYHFSVIGNPIGHSRSPEIHEQFATQFELGIRYQRLSSPIAKDAFAAVVTAFFAGGGTGANVTLPFKLMAYELCDDLSDYAEQAGAVNTLYQRGDGQLVGDNTDGIGLVSHIQQLNWQLDGARVAIIGAGGAAQGCLLPLLQANIQHLTIANRTVTKAEKLIHQAQNLAQTHGYHCEFDTCAIETLVDHFDIVINATSAAAQQQNFLLNPTLSATCAYDMMYGKPSAFLEFFEQQQSQVSDGLGMLIGQAAKSFEIWTGLTPDTTLITLSS